MEIIKIILVLAAFVLFFLLLNKLEKSEKFNSGFVMKILQICSGIGVVSIPFIFEINS